MAEGIPATASAVVTSEGCASAARLAMAESLPDGGVAVAANLNRCNGCAGMFAEGVERRIVSRGSHSDGRRLGRCISSSGLEGNLAATASAGKESGGRGADAADSSASRARLEPSVGAGANCPGTGGGTACMAWGAEAATASAAPAFGGNCRKRMAICMCVSTPASISMRSRLPRPSFGVWAWSVYSPGGSDGKRYAPLRPVVARNSAPEAWLRRTRATPASGDECRSVSLPESDPMAGVWMMTIR